MREILRAGAFALAIMSMLSALPSHATEMSVAGGQVASVDVGRIKAVLRLTPEQEPYWPAVEAALRDVARRQRAQTEEAGLVRRMSNKLVSVVLDSAAIRRLAVAARPLIERLDMHQMQMANNLAHEMGLGAVVTALR